MFEVAFEQELLSIERQGESLGACYCVCRQLLSEVSKQTLVQGDGAVTASASTKVAELLIDGELVGASGGTFTTINPATEEPLGDAADADAADMDPAIAAARAAFDEPRPSKDLAGEGRDGHRNLPRQQAGGLE